MYNFDKIVARFHKEVIVPLYPNQTEDETRLIVKAPFAFLRKSISRDDMPTIRFKYLGTFECLIVNVRSSLKSLEYNLTQGKYPFTERHARDKEQLEKWLEMAIAPKYSWYMKKQLGMSDKKKEVLIIDDTNNNNDVED